MIVLKILAAPFVVVLTVLAAVVSFLFCMATAVFVVACVVLTLLAVALFISGQTLGGIVFLVLAFLISPYGIPAIAEWLVDKLHNLNFALAGLHHRLILRDNLSQGSMTAAEHSRRFSYRKEGCLRQRPISKSTKSAREKLSRNR